MKLHTGEPHPVSAAPGGRSLLARLRGRLRPHLRAVSPLDTLLGVFLGVSVAVHGWSWMAFSPWAWLAIPVCVALGVALAHGALVGVVYPGLQRYSPRLRSAWVLACLLAGFALLDLIPVTIYPKPQVVRIAAPGTKNAASNGSEVWLSAIQTGRTALPAHLLSCAGPWREVDGLLMSPSEWQPSVLTCAVRTDADIQIQFVEHPWSGNAGVTYGEQKFAEDLYAPESGGTALVLDVRLSPAEELLRAFLLAAAGVSLGMLLLAASVYLAGWPVRAAPRSKMGAWAWAGYALALAAAWLAYLLAFWPGFFSPDTLYQFRQVASGEYNNMHPAIHTLFLWLLTRAWLAPTPVILAHIALLAGLLGWGLALLNRLGTPRRLAWLIVLFLAGSPALGLILLNPWKDVTYTIAVIGFTFLLLRWAVEPAGEAAGAPQRSPRPWFWLLLGFAAALTALFRQNGVVVGFGVLALLVPAAGGRRRGFALALAVSLAIYYLVTGPFYAAMRVDTKSETLGQNLGPYAEAAYISWYQHAAGTPMTADELELFQQIFPAGPKAELSALGSRPLDVARMAAALSLRNPGLTLRYWQNKLSYIFQVLQPPNARVGYVEMAIYPNPFGLEPDSQLPRLQNWLVRLSGITTTAQFDWFFWRNAFWMYWLIFCAGVAWLRLKNWKLAVVILPVLFNAIPLAWLSGGHIARYIFPTLILGPVLGVGLLFLQPMIPTNLAFSEPSGVDLQDPEAGVQPTAAQLPGQTPVRS